MRCRTPAMRFCQLNWSSGFSLPHHEHCIPETYHCFSYNSTVTCRTCGQDKAAEEFPFRKASRGVRHKQCLSCFRAYAKEQYEQGRSRGVERVLAARAVKQREVLGYLLVHPCVDCGEKDPIVLEFDHRGDDKIKHISGMLTDGAPMARVWEEVAKCDVRCANCHRRMTARRNGHWLKAASRCF